MQQHGVAVGLGAHDRFGADIGGAAAAILDHHLLAPDFRQLAGDHARDGVGAAARRERHDQAHEAVRPGRSAARGRRRRGGSEPASAAPPGSCRARRRDHGYSLTLMLAALMTGAHLSISALRWVASASGVEPTAMTPALELGLDGGLGDHRDGVGVHLADDLGRRLGRHEEGEPRRGVVARHARLRDRRHLRGRLTRSAVVTPSARSLFERTSGRPEAMTAKLQSTRPAITSV